ncbi:MAG: hypothetical protein K9M44_02585 [Candidatus Pacebacteria bacterium]|nr:hypothetical protein [Candidatus Paceibacterota bacterium]
MKIKSNFFYLIISVLALIVVALFTVSQAQPENQRSQQNLEFIGKFNKSLSSLGQAINWTASLVPDYREHKFKPSWKNVFNNPLKNSVEVISSVQVETSDKINNLNIEDLDNFIGRKELIKSQSWLGEKGFFFYRENSDLFLGWQSSKGKRFSLTIPY